MFRRLACACALLFTLVASRALAQEVTVTGVIVSDTGDAVSGARLTIADAPGSTVSDGAGRFSLVMPTGRQTLVITRDGFEPLAQPITVPTSRPLALRIELTHTLTLSQELTVVGRVSDYVDATASAARTSAPLRDIPQAIAVLPARFLADVGALDTKDLYRYISGVTDSPYSSTVVRGFTQREVLVDGLRGNPYGSLDGDIANAGFSTSQFRLSNLERVEILKGPSSVLFGSSEPGGVINYVTKKPRDTFGVIVNTGTGQFRQALTEFDVSGPAMASGRLLYRAAVYFENRDGFRLNTNTRNTHAIGQLTWRAAERTAVAFEYQHIDQLNDGHRLRGIPVTATGEWLAGYRWTATEPTDFTDLKADVAQVRLDHRWRRGLKLDSTLRRLSYDRRENYHEPRGITGGGLVMQREFRDQFRTNDDWSWATNLSGTFSRGRAGRHDIAVGGDLFRQDHFYEYATARQQSSGGPVPPLALANPAYGQTSPATYGLTSGSYLRDTALTTRGGLYVQDLIVFGPRWNALIGGRVDRFVDRGTNGAIPLAAERSAATGRLGLVFKPQTNVSLYGSVANGFNRAAVLSQSPTANGPHDPETSRQVEAGAKSEWLEGRAQLTVAAYRSVKRNVLRPDPAQGPTGNNLNAALSTGEVRNQGVEVDMVGSPLPRWNVAANYAFLDSEITADVVAALVGRRMPNAATHTAGLFTRVDLVRGAAAGMSLQHVGTREEPFAGIVAPRYTVIDAHYFQRLSPHARLTVKVENLFDRQYAASALFVARAGNIPGQPRTVSVAVTLTSRPDPVRPAR